MGKRSCTLFYAFLVFIFLTATGALSQASLQCDSVVGKPKFPYLHIPDAAVFTNASGKTLIKTDILMEHYKQQSEKLKALPTQDLINELQKLLEIEYSEYGGLVGIIGVKPNAIGFILDLGIQRDDAGPNATYESNRHWLTYYRNQLQAVTFLYPHFFKETITAPAFPAIPIRIEGGDLKPPTDFRLHTILVQRELTKRLADEPLKTFQDLGLQYPSNNQIWLGSLQALRDAIYF